MQARYRSISTPITLTSIAVSVTIALLIAWTVVIANGAYEGQVWLLVLGITSFAFLVVVLLLSGVGLARGILEIRRQNTFVDSVTHELKSPLAALRLGLETLDRPDVKDSQRAEVRAMMRDDVERLSAFIDDVLEASRLSHLREGVPLARVDLADLARATVATVTSRHGVDPACVSVAIPPGLAVQTDRTSLETIFKNLIDNALKYSGPDPPEVRIAAERRPDKSVVVTFADRGIGIPAADVRRVFKRFYRVDDEAVRARRGTGLGLFVVAALARGLGARLVAASPGPGQGTTMTLTLPTSEAP
ncbi:MAG: HAMP domain-containing histidine kinase [Deltaproteobacteria bacterium]|nr:HAMP domain-containing histidine kinase [Deltaproteobacteria bacterium]